MLKSITTAAIIASASVASATSIDAISTAAADNVQEIFVLAVQEITGDDAAARTFIEAATDRFTTRTDITNQVGGTAYSIGSFLRTSVVAPLEAQLATKTAELATANANLQAAYRRFAVDNATIGTLSTLNADLTADLTAARATNVDLTADLVSARSNNAQLTAQVNSVFVQLDAQVDELDRLEDEVASLTADVASLNQQIVDGMAMADANRVQAEAALAAMTQHKNNWKARALDMEVHKNNWKAMELASRVTIADQNTKIAAANAVSTVVTDDTQLRDHIDGDNVYNNMAGAHSQADGTVYLSNFYEANSSHNFNINTDFIGDIATKISDVINAEAEAAYDRGYEDGFRDGFAAGVASVQSELN